MRKFLLVLLLCLWPSVNLSQAQEADDGSFSSYISADGSQVFFMSVAANLPTSETRRLDAGDMFVYERETDSVSQIIIPENGGIYDGGAYLNIPSPDGRFVPFLSWIDLPDMGGGLYLLDRESGEIEALNISESGEIGDSSYPYEMLHAAISISDDGRFVMFLSRASNLVPDDDNGEAPDLFLLDRETGTLERIITSGMAGFPTEALWGGVISGNGRYIAFDSNVAGERDTNGTGDVFLYDRNLERLRLVSIGLDGFSANGRSQVTAISPDGQYLLFASAASNLVPDDNNGSDDSIMDSFLYDQQTNDIERVTVGVDGIELDNYSYASDLSPDGRYIVFASGASNAFPNDTAETGRNVYRLDRETGELLLISRSIDGGYSQGWSYEPSISDDGRWIAFASDANDLVPDDTNGFRDIFLFDADTGEIERISVPNS